MFKIGNMVRNVAGKFVDVDTGQVDILNYVMAHDSGYLINPMVVDGQVRGATAHGIGNALYERLIYDDDAQPQTTTFADYLLPTAMEIPDIGVVHTESPTPMNPLGVKGAGEGGTIPAPAAIAAAIEDALSPWNVKLTATPMEPGKLVELIGAGRAGQQP